MLGQVTDIVATVKVQKIAVSLANIQNKDQITCIADDSVIENSAREIAYLAFNIVQAVVQVEPGHCWGEDTYTIGQHALSKLTPTRP